MKARSVLTKVMSLPPLSRSRSCLMVVYPCMMGVLCLFVNLVSCMVSGCNVFCVYNLCEFGHFVFDAVCVALEYVEFCEVVGEAVGVICV